jgi:hypothetical protein
VTKEEIIAQFPVLFPLAVQWAAGQERRIVAEGVVLTPEEVEDANAVGIRDLARVRLLPVTVIPRPDHPDLQAACDAIDFLTVTTRGLTLGHGIFIRQDCWRDRELVAHELVHTAQYERLGGIEHFLQQYLAECLTVGYENSSLEREAQSMAAGIRPRTLKD